MSKRNENRAGYKKTKVGWIPKEWDVQPLGSIANVVRGASPRPAGDPRFFNGNYLPWVTVADVTKDTTPYLRFTKNMLTKEGAACTRIFPPITLLLTNSGATLGVPKILEIQAGANDGIAGFLKLNIDMRYAYYLLLERTQYFRERLAPGVGQPNLNTEIIGSVLIPISSSSEQKKIAEILSTWDEAIEQVRKLIDAKKRRKKALMQQLLTGKKRLPGFKEEWKTYRLSELLRQISRRVEFDDQSIYDLISVRRRSGGIFSRGKIAGHTIQTKQMYLAKEGDFLISKMQIVHGASALVTKGFDSMHISGSYIALRVRDSQKLDVYFLNWLSKTLNFYHLTYLSSYGVHIEKMTFNLRLFLKSKISIPKDVKEQHRIAEALSTADEEIETLEKKLAALEKQKRGMMQKLLTGEVRVKT